MRFKNEVIVGVVVVLGMIVAVAGAFWLSGRPWAEEQAEIRAVFTEVGELRVGNPVKYRGVQVGRVTDIGLSESGRGVLVTMEIRPDVTLPPLPAVILSPASLFGDWQAELVTQGSIPGVVFTATTTPGVLPGAALPDITELTAIGARIAGNLETLAQRVEIAFTEETALKLRETIDNVQEISEQLSGFVDQQTETYAQVGENIRRTTARVDAIAGELQGAFSEGGEVDQILASAREASANLAELSVQLESATRGLPQLVARADTTLGNINRVAVSVGSVVDEVGPQVRELGPTIAETRQAVATLQRAAARIEQGEGTLGRLVEDPALYEETQRAIATLQRLLADLQANPTKYIGAIRLF